MTGSSLKFLEPILSTTRICFEQLNMYDEAKKNSFELSAIPKEGDKLRSPAATTVSGLCMKCKDQGMKQALLIETAQIQRLQGHALGSLLAMKEEFNQPKQSSEVQQGKRATTIARQVPHWLINAWLVNGSWIAHSLRVLFEVVLEYFQ